MENASTNSRALSRRVKRAVVSAERAISNSDDLADPDRADIEAVPLLRDLGRLVRAGALLLARWIVCGDMRQQLDQIEDLLDNHGDQLTSDQKQKLENTGERLWESITRNC